MCPRPICSMPTAASASATPSHGTVDSAAIVRGYEYGPGRHVIAQPDELDALRPVQDKALRLERFLAPDQLNPLLFAGRSLYLVPDGPAAEPGYGVLRLGAASRPPGAKFARDEREDELCGSSSSLARASLLL